VAVVSLWACSVHGSSVDRGQASVDQIQLDRIEDWSEEFANQLHDLSLAIKERDVEGLAAHFDPGLQATGWPAPGGEQDSLIKWVATVESAWTAEAVGRFDFLRGWMAYLAGFSEIEDVRLKVKKADFTADTDTLRVAASVYLSIIGRNQPGQHQSGQRAWVEAKAAVGAARARGETGESGQTGWRIDQFEFTSFDSRVTDTDLFSEVAVSAGVFHAVPPFGSPGNPEFGAHGVAVHDVDGDGLLDVFTTGLGENFLYINRGDGTFENRAQATGLKTTPSATSPLFLDYDNDGDSDLFLSATGMQMLFENQLLPSGQLAFVDVSFEANVDRPAQGFSAVSADVNGDGFPDVYVASYNRYGRVMPDSWSLASNGTPNLLFINQGDGRFEERASAWNVADSRWSYAAHFGDLNGDGRVDLYVANDFGENGLYLNEGDSFRASARELDMLDPGNGMGLSMGDYDNDGLLDLHVTNMSSTAGNRILKRLFPDEGDYLEGTQVLTKLAAGNTLFRNLGGGKFEDVSAQIGPLASGWAWGGGFVDFDNDGWQDIHSPNGFISGKSLKDT